MNITEEKLEYITNMGFKTLESYISWCRDNQFSTNINKGLIQLKRERKFLKDSYADHVLETSKNADIKSTIMQYNSGKVVNQVGWVDELYKVNDKKQVTDFLFYLNRKTKILEDKEYTKILHKIFRYSDNWIRPIHKWNVKSKSVHRQFSLLLRHLFAKYEVPAFMDSAWLSDSHGITWFIHVGSGKNIRTAQNLPFPLTKKEAHLFMLTPSALSIDNGFTYAQIMNNGGDERLVRTLLGTRISEFSDNIFKNGLMKLFVDNPMLDHEQMGPIIDYIWTQKFENRREYTVNGEETLKPPPQPNFALAGRTIETLMTQVNRWHRQLGKERKGGDLQWPHGPVGNFHCVVGTKEKKKEWSIIELLSSKELASEGRSMNHCVSSYARSCYSRRTTIWSLRNNDAVGTTYIHLTIEVNQGQIRQMRGKNNRLPSPKERNIIDRWASKEDLKFSTVGFF